MPQVTVVIPTHNRAEFLHNAITSVLNQTFQCFEIIVVDDASTDNTVEVVNRFAEEKIKLVRHSTRKGGAAARNTGILNSCGEYIAFLDDDDEWYQEKLARQMDVMIKSGPEIAAVYTGYLIVERSSRNICGRMNPSHRGNLYSTLLASNPLGCSTKACRVFKIAIYGFGSPENFILITCKSRCSLIFSIPKKYGLTWRH
jgi:glycosyltransferase involved in cell wall biosynthesis